MMKQEAEKGEKQMPENVEKTTKELIRDIIKEDKKVLDALGEEED